MQRTRTVADIDLTDETALLAEDAAERDPQGTRALLAALNLQNPAAPAARPDDGFDAAIYRITGDRHLASLFGCAV